jgi:virulence-associated protein VagC
MKTRVFQSGNSKAVRLPKGLDLSCGEVSIRKEGDRLVIEQLGSDGWPNGFFEAIQIDRDGFGRTELDYRERSL